jgi:tRNA threonylcarbamoyladenosine biosynthesis protein TsaE
MKTRTVIAASPEETRFVAREIARNAVAGSCFALYGDIGTGKTLFTKAFAKELGISDEVTSPTFTLCEEYTGRLSFYHFDLYRIENQNELDLLYFEEYWESDGVSVIEWAERAEGRLPENTIKVTLTYINEHTRRIDIVYPFD